MYKKNFITTGKVCEQGRAQYYAILQKAKQGELVRINEASTPKKLT